MSRSAEHSALLSRKFGAGAGAVLSVYRFTTLAVVGHITFNERGDWQVTDSEPRVPWEVYEDALAQARVTHPKG